MCSLHLCASRTISLALIFAASAASATADFVCVADSPYGVVTFGDAADSSDKMPLDPQFASPSLRVGHSIVELSQTELQREGAWDVFRQTKTGETMFSLRRERGWRAKFGDMSVSDAQRLSESAPKANTGFDSHRPRHRKGFSFRFLCAPMKRFFFGTAVWPLAVAAAAGDAVELIDDRMARPVDVSVLQVDWSALEYESPASVRGIQQDWNGDGRVDTLIVAAQSLCGTGGCPYELFDGKSGRKIGELFGRPIFFDSQKINGWPVLTMYSHLGSDSGIYQCMVFDGTKYVQVSSVMLYGRSVTELIDELVSRTQK